MENPKWVELPLVGDVGVPSGIGWLISWTILGPKMDQWGTPMTWELM